MAINQYPAPTTTEPLIKSVTKVISPAQLQALDATPLAFVAARSATDLIVPVLFALHKPAATNAYTTSANLLIETVSGTAYATIALNSATEVDLTATALHTHGYHPGAGSVTNALAGQSLQLKASGAISGSGSLPNLIVTMYYYQIDPAA